MTKKNIKFLIDTTKGYRLRFTLLFVCIVVATLTSLVFPHLIGEIIDTVFYDVNLMKFSQWFIAYALIYFVNQLFNVGVNYCYAVLKSSYLMQIRRICYSHLINLKSRVLIYLNSGDIVKRMDSDVDAFLDVINFDIFYSINDILYLAGSIIYLMTISWTLGVATLVIVPLMYYMSTYFMGILEKKYKLIASNKGFLSAWIYEIIKGIHEIKVLNAGNYIHTKYMNLANDITKKEVDASYEKIKSERINLLFILLGELVILSISAYYIASEQISVGQFVACETYFASCIAYYKRFNSRLAGMTTHMVAISRISEFIELEEERNIYKGIDHTMKTGEIVFQNVEFSYGDIPVLRGINLKIGDGEHVAIVGKSGEGKSTIIDLINGIYNIDSGTLKIDNIDVDKFSLKSLRNQIGVVQQKNVIFERSLRYNIAFTEEKSVDVKVWELLKLVNMSEYVKSMPEGLNTVLEENRLSGGQKQKIAIARVLYKQPKILIFDEATSAIDGESETEIEMIIKQSFKEKTRITISHRFSSILRAERIIVVDNGKVIAQGDDSTLLKCEVYRKLYNESDESGI